MSTFILFAAHRIVYLKDVKARIARKSEGIVEGIVEGGGGKTVKESAIVVDKKREAMDSRL